MRGVSERGRECARVSERGRECVCVCLMLIPSHTFHRHAISLYAKISNIKWHYDEDVVVSGCELPFDILTRVLHHLFAPHPISTTPQM